MVLNIIKKSFHRLCKLSREQEPRWLLFSQMDKHKQTMLFQTPKLFSFCLRDYVLRKNIIQNIFISKYKKTQRSLNSNFQPWPQMIMQRNNNIIKLFNSTRNRLIFFYEIKLLFTYFYLFTSSWEKSVSSRWSVIALLLRVHCSHIP